MCFIEAMHSLPPAWQGLMSFRYHYGEYIRSTYNEVKYFDRVSMFKY